MDALLSMMSKTETQKEKLEKETAFHSLMKFLPRSKRSILLYRIKSNSRMSFKDKETKVSIKS
jgi:hypothetical protein